MKTDYRVICCVVAWLCCAAVDCRKEWDNLDGNGIERFGREYDDSFDDLRKTYNFARAEEDPVDEEKCKATCGDGYAAKEVICKKKNDDEVECSCKGELVFDYGAKECKAKCGEDCQNTGGKCPTPENDEFVKCNCPENTILEETSNKCIEDKCKATCGDGYAAKEVICKKKNGEEVECTCKEELVFDYEAKECKAKCGEDCENTGGECPISMNNGFVNCHCPANTILEESNKCIVEEKQCTTLFPRCQPTGGSCISSPKGIECSCPKDTTLDAEKNCIVEAKKCENLFPNCIASGGTCLSSPKGIKCNCPADTSLDETNNKCIVDGAKCKALHPDCESSGGTCLLLPAGIKCSCPNDMKLDEENNKCLDTCQSICGLGKDETENDAIKCNQDSGTITCQCIKGTALAFDYTKKQCVACECGDKSKGCKFEGGKKTCLCEDQFADKQGKCLACECGDKSKGCKFEGDKKTCLCEDQFADKQGKCSACECGVRSTGCKFEGDKKICLCQDKYADKQGKCSICDCGPKSEDCQFKDDKKVCTCKKGYEDEDEDGSCEMTKCTDMCGDGHEEKGIRCIEKKPGDIECKCKESSKGFDYVGKQCKDCDCGPNSTGCLFLGKKKVCGCKDDHADKEGSCTACECGKDAIGCSFNNGKTCKCKEKYAEKNGKCENCKCGEFSVGCSFKGDEKSCDCKKNYLENKETEECQTDYCQIKCGCDVGGCKDEDLNCEGDYFKEADLKCVCSNEKKFDASKEIMKCRIPCKTKEDCKHGAECLGSSEVKFCSCPAGTSGDTCQDVKECADGGKYEKCRDEKGTCGFKEGKAVCECEKGKKLDEVVNYCVDTFCFEKNCKDNSTCNYDTTSHTGYCVCPNGKYYDYQANRCKVPDKCLLKKTACKENEVCVDGECKCPYEVEEDKCISKFCKSKPCFQGADCNEADGTCTCAEGKYFTGSRCENKTCILQYDDYAEKCPCPTLLVRGDDKKCVPKSGSKPCDKDCGYGHCVNNNCKCFVGAEIKDQICVLKKTFCASGELVSGSQSQCKCTGKYKQAKDGKTCELVTCEDESAKSFCAQKGATCRMRWKVTPQFECVCPDGYAMDMDRDICSDACSMQKNIDACLKDGAGRFCFSSNSKENLLTGDCRCPPPFTNTKGCLGLDANTHLITGIHVLKKNYEMKNGINHVLLNTHLTQSLAQTYTSAVFDYGYLHDYEVHDKEIVCSVWLRFKQSADEQLERLRFQASQFTEGVCADCDTNMYVWPPALPLSKKLEEVYYESLTLCSNTVKDKLCGREASCNEKSGCYCPRGFKMLEYTYRLTNDNKRIQRCEAATKGGDLDECLLKTHNCSENSDCVKIPGDFICQCKPGYWKENNYDKTDCQDLCAKKPCDKGTCSMKKEAFNCKCEPGYGGSLCDEKDVNFASAKKSTVIVGAVLGTILIVGIIAFLLYYRKIRKSTYSEDFVVAPSHSEMTERRPMRGITNKSYE